MPSNVFYNGREFSTNRPCFLQNKANFRKSQMDVSLIISSDYENILHWTLGENKPNQSQLPPAQGWGLKVANDINYHLRCLKNLPTNMTRTRVYAGVKKS